MYVHRHGGNVHLPFGLWGGGRGANSFVLHAKDDIGDRLGVGTEATGQTPTAKFSQANLRDITRMLAQHANLYRPFWQEPAMEDSGGSPHVFVLQ
jgi:hypothetical protein